MKSILQSVAFLIVFYPALLPSVAAEEVAAHPIAQHGSDAARVITENGAPWFIKTPKADPVEYHGIVNLDNAGGGQGQMMYPAPNLAGFFAAVVTHGVINEATKNTQKAALQKGADGILSPYQNLLTAFRQDDFARLAMNESSLKGKVMLTSTEQGGDSMASELKPVYFFSLDEMALVLENEMTIGSGTDGDSAPRMLTVKVISAPHQNATLKDYWMAEQGAKLKEESIRLLVESIQIALHESQFDSNRPDKTVRYRLGSVEKMERGKLVGETCGRAIIRTLRGALLSVPVATAANENCMSAQLQR
jgi:hypothetical protein